MPSPSSSADDPDASPGPTYAAAYADVDPEGLVRVGFVFRPHGVHGELKVDPEDTGDPTRYESWDQVFVGARPHLDGIDSRDDAEAITKRALFVHEDDLDLDDEEIFIHDLIGLDVETEDGTRVGTVLNLLELPAHDVLVVRRSDGQEAMIPAVDDFVLALDLDAGSITVRPIEGMID